MPGWKYSDETIERAIELREAGQSAKEIAAELGMSRGAVDYHCLKLGADLSARPMTRMPRLQPAMRNGHLIRFYTEEEDRRLLAMEADGASISEMARVLGRRMNSISTRLSTLARREEYAEEAA